MPPLPRREAAGPRVDHHLVHRGERARLAASDPHVAGIANELAAETHGAVVRERDIEDHFGNQTLFALIGRQGHEPVFTGDRCKTTLALFLQQDRAGT